MHRIFIVEPSQMLRHAFVIALSSEYQIVTSADFPAANLAAMADVIIVNAATLRVNEMLDGNKREMARAWKKPVIWIDDEEIAESGELSMFNRLHWPIDRGRLKAAVATCLQKVPPTSERANKTKRVTPLQTVQSSKALPISNLSEKKLIELVDIVE
jgi:DNA-binding LytR/AlgR family response regulator